MIREMKLGFHYHIEIEDIEGDFYLPGFLGVFVDSLAANVNELVLFFHLTSTIDRREREYKLRSSNVKLVSLGKKESFQSRFFRYNKFLNKVKDTFTQIDKLIVRGPSPLLPHFHKYIENDKITYLLVGDYLESAKELDKGGKAMVIYCLMYLYQKAQNKTLKKANILVNSTVLHDKIKTFSNNVLKINTTTLSKDDFYYREDTCQEDVVKLLYTGRYDWSKGLRELIEAMLEINITKSLELHIVGWEDSGKTSVTDGMKYMINELGISNVIIHGKKSIGEELNAMYRMADVYVLPSYMEGFPRTIWEAMANGLPIISTKVGSIPETLDDNCATLINPKSKDEIVQAVERVFNNSERRKSMIKNAYKLVRDMTLETQSKKIIKFIYG